MPFTSIRARMTGAFALAIASLLLIGGITLTRQARRTAERRCQELLGLAADRAGWEMHEPDNRANSLVDIVRKEQGELAAGDIAMIILNAQGHAVWRSRKATPHWPMGKQEQELWRVKTFTARGQTLVLALPWAGIESELREHTLQLMALGGLMLIASSLGTWIMVGRTLAPIDHLSHQAQNAAPDRLRVRLTAPSPDAELVHLVGTLNGLLERLEKDAAARGRFYAAASHELRTPLQALVGELDVILSRPREREDYRETLEAVQQQSLRLMTLVQELLQLNQLEMAPSAPPAVPVDLGDLIQRQWQGLQATADRRRLRIEPHLLDIEVLMPPAHGEILCRNLLENAAKYAPEGTAIRVAMEEHAKGARLEICNLSDTTPGADLSLWFEPFYRLDASRNSQTGGNGLGLAICKAICDVNGWEITLRHSARSIEVRVDFTSTVPIE